MAENAPSVIILCAQCSRRARVRRGEPPPEGWMNHGGLYSCSETCRDILETMGLLPEA